MTNKRIAPRGDLWEQKFYTTKTDPVILSHLRSNRKIATFIEDHRISFRNMFYNRNPQYFYANITVEPVNKYSRKRVTGVQFYVDDEPVSVMTFNHALSLTGLLTYPGSK